MMILLIWLGVYPQPVFKTSRSALNYLQQIAPIASPPPERISNTVKTKLLLPVTDKEIDKQINTKRVMSSGEIHDPH
jgi:hypothetical protein